MRSRYFSGGTLILPDRTVLAGALLVEDGCIAAVGRAVDLICSPGAERVDVAGGYIGPG